MDISISLHCFACESWPTRLIHVDLCQSTIHVLPGVSGIVEAFDNLLQNHATLLFLKRLCRISFGYPDGKQIRIQRVLGEEDHFIYMTEQGEPGEQSSEQNVSLTALHPKDSNDSTGSNSNGTCDGNAFQCFRYAMHHFRVPEGDVKAALGQPDEITLRLAFPLDACTNHDSVARAHSQRQCSKSLENQ